jgi:hypothetical protein
MKTIKSIAATILSSVMMVVSSFAHGSGDSTKDSKSKKQTTKADVKSEARHVKKEAKNAGKQFKKDAGQVKNHVNHQVGNHS